MPFAVTTALSPRYAFRVGFDVVVSQTIAKSTASETPSELEVASGCEVRLAVTVTPVPLVVTLATSSELAAGLPSEGPTYALTFVVSVALVDTPPTPTSLIPTAVELVVGVLVPPAERLTLPAVTFARSSMWAAIVPAVVDSRSKIATSIRETWIRSASVVAVAVRVAVSVAAPEPRSTVALKPM